MKLSIPVFLVAFIFLFFTTKAQQPHFIYIQTENELPFYVKINKTIYSSTVSGYVIISKLFDSTYNLSVGFLKNEWPQQNFNCTINKKDEGYVLKNFGDKGWGLFNLETMDVIMANISTEEKKIMKEERTDSFSNMLSAAVNDPGIKQKEIVKPDIQVADTNKPTRINVTSTIKRISQNTNKYGTELVYLDITATNKDTVRLFLPVDETQGTLPQKNIEKVIIDTVKKEPVKEEQNTNATTVKADTISKIVVTKAAPKIKPDTIAPIVKPVMKVTSNENKETIIAANNNGCTNIATDEDFLKLRKKMAAENTDNDMLNIAKKAFKTKCFTTIQIKNLSFLFLKDEGKYQFFDIAYSFVSDPENFGSLQSQLTDADYIDRFKLMIHH